MDEPPQLARRPHHGLYPIPWVTSVIDGKVDFRVHDEHKRRMVVELRLCQLCGEKLGTEAAFIGFDTALDGMRFGEPPAHRECLDYALEICPWLSGRPYSEREHDPRTSLAARPAEPELMVIYTCLDFHATPDPSGVSEIIYQAGWATQPVEYYRRPVPVSS